MRIVLVVLILIAWAFPALATEISGRVIDVDREQGVVVLEVTDDNDSLRRVTVETSSIPVDIRLGETLSVETQSAVFAENIVASKVENGLGSSDNADRTGVRSRLLKVKNNSRFSSQSSGRGRH
nr:hypothetical protein [uncultured Desulfuromonas sp.]